MSMLTPPGMGGKYKITGNAYPRMRRPRGRRRAVISVAVLAAAGVLGWGGLELADAFTGDHTAQAAQLRKCGGGSKGAKTAERAARASADALPGASQITVNVYNATPRSGLAKRAAKELKDRGFKIGKVGNADAKYDKKVKESAVLVGGPKAEPALSVLGAHLTGTRSSDDRRKGDAVDLVIGKAFKDFDPPERAEKALTALTRPSPVPDAKRCRS